MTVVQRFGSALNLNIHLHSIIPDGVWEVRPSGKHVFRKLGQPQEADIQRIGWRACRGLLRYLRKTGQWSDLGDDDGHLDTSDDAVDPLLAEVYGASIRGRLAIGEGRGSRVLLLRCGPQSTAPQQATEKAKQKGYSFDVNAGVSVRAGDRSGLTRLCRYLCRPPAGNERFTKRADGRIVVRLKTAWRDGTSHIVLTPLALTEKLVALIPPPRVNMTRYHGVFAPNAAARASIVPQPSVVECQDEDASRCTYAGRQAYALLMKRVFAIDVEVCRDCGARNTRIDFFTTKDAIENELRNRGPPIQVDLPGIAA